MAGLKKPMKLITLGCVRLAGVGTCKRWYAMTNYSAVDLLKAGIYTFCFIFLWWCLEALVKTKAYRRIVVGEKDTELDHILKGEGER